MELKFFEIRGKLSEMCDLSPTVIFIKNRSERKGQTVARELMSYAMIYLFISPEQESILKKKRGGKNPKIRPQSESMMSALTIIQDVRHGTPVHIYSLLLPGKYRIKIKVSLCINILIVTARKFKYSLQNVNSIQMRKHYCVYKRLF